MGQTEKSDFILLSLRAAKIALVVVLVYVIVDVHGLVIGLLLKLNTSATEMQALMQEQRVFLKQQQTLWNNPKTQESIGLILRQGNEFAKFMDHSQGAAKETKLLITDLRGTIKETDGLIKEIKNTSLPNINDFIKEASSTLTIIKSGSKETLEASTATIKQMEELLKNQNVLDALANIAATTGNINKTSALIALSAEDIHEGLPVLIKALQDVAANAAATAMEIKTFATQFNKPTPAYIKILRYVVAVLGPALPVLAKK